MRYFDVTAVNADGTPNTLHFDHVSEWSLKSLTEFFSGNGVVLKPTFSYSIDDKPVWYKDPETSELLLNTGQVV